MTTQMVQDKLLVGFGMGDARQTNSAPFAQIKPDFDQDDLFKRVNYLGWRRLPTAARSFCFRQTHKQ